MRRAKRTFIGFADDQSLDDFEATAQEAEHLLSTFELALCRFGSEPEPDGSWLFALEHGVEILGVRFTRADLTLAEVELRGLSDLDPRCPGSGGHWIVHVKRDPKDWLVVGVARRRALTSRQAADP